MSEEHGNTPEGKDVPPPGVPDLPAEPDPDAHLGALETDRPGQPGQGNANLPALDQDGLPEDWKKICEDVIGANVDESQG